MKLTLITLLLCTSCNIQMFGQIEVPNPFKKGQSVKLPKIESAHVETDRLIQKIDGKSPISTSFDDAIYEAEALNNFEPAEEDYRPLEIQPTAETGGFRLKSGLYTMNARSFCLHAGTYGPSRGDGHLFAPLKGKKAEFVQAILERYGKKPTIPQGNIQVLLWAIVAGADMNNMSPQYMKTLNELFTTEELLKYKGKDYLKGMADKEVGELKQMALGRVSPQLQKIFDADNKIRAMVSRNFAYKEMEAIAVLSGIAPEEDKIREVSKGRWSYHPDGFFVRFFPHGYQQTRVDIYVPFEGNVKFDSNGKIKALNGNKGAEKEVIYNPSKTVAAPANRGSQRIAQSPVPIDPCLSTNKTLDFHVSGVPVIPQPNSFTCWAACAAMMYWWHKGRPTNTSISIALFEIENGDYYFHKKYVLSSDIEWIPWERWGLTDNESYRLYIKTMGLHPIQMPNSIGEFKIIFQKNGPILAHRFFFPMPTKEHPKDGLSDHVIIITGIHGDGTPGCTYFDVIDPDHTDTKGHDVQVMERPVSYKELFKYKYEFAYYPK